MGKTWTNLTDEELCDLMCGDPEKEHEEYLSLVEQVELDSIKSVRDYLQEEEEVKQTLCSFVNSLNALRGARQGVVDPVFRRSIHFEMSPEGAYRLETAIHYAIKKMEGK